MKTAAPNSMIHAALTWLALDRMEADHAEQTAQDFTAPASWSGPEFSYHEAARDTLDRASREQLIEWLEWNDNGNGVYSDADCELEGLEPITKAQATDLALNQIAGV